ncbi:uncharacterized protein N7469_007945 [Penicillium citrinum]|uniref:PQ loop repeat protein n=1 Tax=Penicillium citrinum TaxID=5077 RepID=A0A9W9NQR4_PENCI|nr:uncharacterized protein N7469_007945 [Penicillium citrinum]KAJ5224442.1 hypothetical protein N7469_007945 [Penicillium citrinum]
MDIPIAENVLGTLGAVCWSIQLLPQIIINYKRHNTEGLQGSMMLLWAAAGVPLGVYNIVEEFNIALRIQPQILTTLSLITWAQCLYYGKGFSIAKCIAAVVPLLLVLALLAAGVLRHYWDIYVHRTVRGISFFFVGIDAAGDLFSLVSVGELAQSSHSSHASEDSLNLDARIVFGPALDVLGMVIYGTELVLWLGIFICGGIFNFAPWLRERSKKMEPAQEVEPVMLHPMPSSTSVFRTASGTVVERRVRGATVL